MSILSRLLGRSPGYRQLQEKKCEDVAVRRQLEEALKNTMRRQEEVVAAFTRDRGWSDRSIIAAEEAVRVAQQVRQKSNDEFSKV